MQVTPTKRETECHDDLHALAEAYAGPNSEPETKAGSLMSGFLKKLGLHATNSDSSTHNILQNGEDSQEVTLWEKQLLAGAEPNARNTTGEVRYAHLFFTVQLLRLIQIHCLLKC